MDAKAAPKISSSGVCQTRWDRPLTKRRDFFASTYPMEPWLECIAIWRELIVSVAVCSGVPSDIRGACYRHKVVSLINVLTHRSR